MNYTDLKLKNSPLVETWLSVDFLAPKVLSSAEFKGIVSSEFSNVKLVQQLAERNTKIEEKGDIRTETTNENRAAGIVVDVGGELPLQVVVKNNRIECKVLGAYPRWDSFIALAKSTLDRCMKHFGAVDCRKVSIRSVNRIFFPDGVKAFSQVLHMLPLDPDDGLQGVCADMLYRDTQYYSEYDAFATIVRAYQRGGEVEKSKTPIYLDIDAFKVARPGVKLSMEDATLDALHALKNRLFIGSITEAQLTLYK